MAYIERETALKIIDNYSKTVCGDGKVIVKTIRDIVDTICPAADVVPVVHGKWEYIGTDKTGNVFRCSKCASRVGLDKETDYCPNCGAKMDGKDGE